MSALHTDTRRKPPIGAPRPHMDRTAMSDEIAAPPRGHDAAAARAYLLLQAVAHYKRLNAVLAAGYAGRSRPSRVQSPGVRRRASPAASLRLPSCGRCRPGLRRLDWTGPAERPARCVRARPECAGTWC